MTGLVLKLSFNKIGDKTLEGGICGSFFFVRPNLAVTAQHVLNSNTFNPNPGFNNCQVWLIVEPNIVIELKLVNLIEHREIDTTLIQLSNDYSVSIRKISLTDIERGHECFNEGFIGGKMPFLNSSWNSNGLQITSCAYNGIITNGSGHIKSKHSMTVDTADIQMTSVSGYATSYGGCMGMSGGPLISKNTDEIIGLMSIGLPADKEEKDLLFAVSIEEINSRIKNALIKFN
jgi:hypothetical protein